MNPEEPGDRLTYLLDFGESCIATPAAGGSAWSFLAIPDRAQRRATELELGEGIAPIEVAGTEPTLVARTLDVASLLPGDVVDVPKWTPARFAVHLVEPDGEEEDFSSIKLLELEP